MLPLERPAAVTVHRWPRLAHDDTAPLQPRTVLSSPAAHSPAATSYGYDSLSPCMPAACGGKGSAHTECWPCLSYLCGGDWFCDHNHTTQAIQQRQESRGDEKGSRKNILGAVVPEFAPGICKLHLYFNGQHHPLGTAFPQDCQDHDVNDIDSCLKLTWLFPNWDFLFDFPHLEMMRGWC